jgi:hypothetical protein
LRLGPFLFELVDFNAEGSFGGADRFLRLLFKVFLQD